MDWRYLNTGKLPGALNMAIDEAVATLGNQRKAPPTIRFFGWEPTCLSVGYFQSVEREVDVEGCRRAGVDLVRRPTGGRAVLHDDELTYSVIALESDPLVSGGIAESYRKISTGLVAGLAGLAVAAEMAPGRSGKASPYRSAACFDSASSYEVMVEGKKLVGSAQVRRGSVVLQHGSLLLGFDGGRLLSLLKLGTAERTDLGGDLEAKATSLEAVAGRRIAFAEVAEALKAGFEDALGIRLVPGALSKEEEELADRLFRDKYSAAEWNFRK